MQPIDAITDIDENTIRSYISIYGGAECGPMNRVLNEWNKNKKTLFRALGQRLSVSKMITIPKSDVIITSELESIYHPYPILYNHDVQIIRDHPDSVQEITNNYFISNILHFWATSSMVNPSLLSSNICKIPNLIIKRDTWKTMGPNAIS